MEATYKRESEHDLSFDPSNDCVQVIVKEEGEEVIIIKQEEAADFPFKNGNVNQSALSKESKPLPLETFGSPTNEKSYTFAERAIVPQNLLKRSTVPIGGKRSRGRLRKVDQNEYQNQQHPRYSCATCSLHFENEESFDEHIDSVHKNYQNDSHGNSSHGNVPIVVPSDDSTRWRTFADCSWRASVTTSEESSSSSVNHINHSSSSRRVKGVPQGSLSGPLTVQSNSMFENHQSIVTTYMKCNLCNETLPSGITAAEHIATKHSIPNSNIQLHMKCELCSAVVVGQKAFNAHMITHHNETRNSVIFECNICKMTFATDEFLRRHKVRCKDPETAPFKCQLCKSGFTTKGACEKHMDTVHLNKREFGCAVCGKMFTRKHILKIHYATHTKEKEFKCNFCNKSFNQKSNLTRHERIHDMTNFGYKCRFCGQLFSQNAYLQTHIKFHERFDSAHSLHSKGNDATKS